MIQFAGLLMDKLFGGLLPLRFISFALVGAFGVLVNVVVLAAVRGRGCRFETSRLAGTLVAMVANFDLNNVITYRDQRLRAAAYGAA